jgi:hypothetical protein
MQTIRSLAIALLAASLVAACGGSSATQAPGSTTGGGGGGGATTTPQQTDAAQATAGGGGGSKPAGWDQFGKASYEISAPVNLSGELGFVPAASVFNGDQGTQLSFTLEGQNVIMTITFTEGKTGVSFASEAGPVIGTNCGTSNLSIQATSASGSFDCSDDVIALMTSGAQVTDVTLKGTFNAHG